MRYILIEYLIVIINLIYYVNGQNTFDYNNQDYKYNEDGEVCFPTSNCGIKNVPCSKNGHCFYDLSVFINDKRKDKEDYFIDCICNRGYTSLDFQQTKCCYKQKSQFTAFLLEVLIGFGAGHLYIGNKTLGIIKMVVVLTFCCSSFLIGFIFCYKSNKNINNIERRYKVMNSVFLIGILVIILWQTTDMILFGINFFTDEYGVELNSW